MRVAKAKRFTAIVILLLVAVAAVLLLFMPARATADGVRLVSNGDVAVSLDGESHAAGDKRMFAATMDILDGAEGGLVFGAENERYFAFKVDRYENEVSLVYCDGVDTQTLATEYFVGPSNMTADERDYVAGRTAEVERVYLRAVITPRDGKTELELYADGIKRFVYTDGSAEAKKLYVEDMEAFGEPLAYNGGKTGYYCGEYSETAFSDITEGQSDHSYYNEIYRNQYHFSQYAHWNNDPNGMVYYNGYYHVYFQHNPYGDVWGPMHWGHARSKDLAHWEMMPIALVPDYEQDGVLGAMWSGSARVYHKGDSELIDNNGDYMWFDGEGKAQGDALGLIGFYTRHDDEEFGGNRYTVVMYSDDGGLTWNKRDAIHRTTSLFFDGYKLGCDENGEPWGPDVRPSWRDPKVFDISKLDGIEGGYKWGMALTGMEDQALYFLKSKDMINWEHAGVYKAECNPECPDVFELGGHTVITLTSRYYIVCDLSFESGKIILTDVSGNKITELLKNDPRLKRMEYGPDSYAAQTFYIDGASDSPYKTRVVGLNWFSGVPGADVSVDSGALAAPRKVWNGGGFTIPVVYGLDGDTLTQTPVVKDDAAFAALKTELVKVQNKAAVAGENLLDGFDARSAEIIATVVNPDKAPISIKVNVGKDRYTEIGWNGTDGYFVSREHSEDGGINQGNYSRKFVSGVGKTDETLDFYILIDRNSVEVFCGGGQAPFYVLTFASPYSTKASMTAEGNVTATVTASSIATGYRASNEIMINLSDTALDLSDALTTRKSITAYASGEDITWSVEEGDDVVEVTKTDDGAVIKGLIEGVAKVKASAGGMSRIIDVTVHGGGMENAPKFEADGIVLGDYYYDGDTLVCSQLSGDGFILSDDEAGDFESYAVRFDLGRGPAAAAVFRASADENGLTDGLIVTYDNNSRIVKLWSWRDGHVYAQTDVDPDITDITVSVRAKGNRVQAAFDGKRVADVILRDGDPMFGKFGLNVCKTRAVFKDISLLDTSTVFGDEENTELELKFNFEQEVTSIINRTLGNSAVPAEYWHSSGDAVTIDEKYMSTLPAAGKYVFAVDGGLSIDYAVNMESVPLCEIASVTLNEKSDASVFVGGRKIEFVFVNDVAVASEYFAVDNYVLTIKGAALPVGDNAIELAYSDDGQLKSAGEFEITVVPLKTDTVNVYVPPRVLDFLPMTVGLCIVAGLILVAAVAFAVIAVMIKQGKITVKPRNDGRTEAYRRRDLGLVAGAAIILPIALFLIVGLITSPYTVSGCVGWIIMLVITVAFGYPYAAQMFWNGKLYKTTTSPMKTRGTPKDIFAVDKSGNKFRIAMRYIAAAFKTLWLCIVIAFYGLISLIQAPFVFVGQMRGLIYGEFGYSAEKSTNDVECKEGK